MRIKKLLTMFVFAGAFCALAYSIPFSFQINQFDAARTDVSDSSLVFEDIMLGYFFDAGYVVSNLPTSITADPENLPVAKALKDAREGYLDYIALVVLVYDRNAKQTTSDDPKFAFTSAVWTLYRVSDGAKISSGRIRTTDVRASDADTTLKNCATLLSRDVDSVLKKI